MLILTRKLNEQILIGDGIVVTVVSIHGNRVRIGIEAPSTTKVYRREMLSSSPDEQDPSASADQPNAPDRPLRTT